MLKALYDYGIRRNLVLPAGYVNKTVKAYISLSEAGDFQGIYMGSNDAIPCPEIGSLKNGGKCNPLVEKRCIVLGEPSKKSDKLSEIKTAFFLDTLRSAANEEPMINACIHALETPETVARIRSELNNQKIKLDDRISFRVGGCSILDCKNLRTWWADYLCRLKGQEDGPQSRCLITGELTQPLKIVPPIKGLARVGGMAETPLICFNKETPAFASYGLKQAANAPVSEEAFSAVKAALDDLLKDAPILAGMKFVHWYDRDIAQEDDLLDFDVELPDEDDADPQVNEQAMRNNADTVPLSVRSGQTVRNLDQTSYFILLLSGVNGRIMVRKYDRGNYADLRRNLNLWYSDLALTNNSGLGRIKQVKLTARLLRLLKYQKTDRHPLERLGKELAGTTPSIINAILTAGPLPDSVASKALAYIRSDLLCNEDTTAPSSLACQWLKVWLLRKNRMYHQEVPILEEYNMNLANAAYHCGGLMAVYAAIQSAAMPDLNTGIVERYYASAIQMPALVIGQLSSRSNHHLEKLQNKWLANRYQAKLREVSVVLGTNIPTTLNLEQQSYFALGYYQMGALLNREKNEQVAAAKAKAAASAK